MESIALNNGVRIYLDSGDIVKVTILAIAAVLLELWLSRREKWWPGLLLPLASFLWAVADFAMCMGMVSGTPFGIRLGAYLEFFLLENIRTLALLILYAVCRERRRRKLRKDRELDKMNIDDL